MNTVKRLSQAIGISLLCAGTAVAAAPFNDVKDSHWAAEAINALAEKGLINGYPGNRFEGNKQTTRYELAIITAKLLGDIENNKGKFDKSDIQTVEKLTVEFADELKGLGIKATSLDEDMKVVKEDVANLKWDVAYLKKDLENAGRVKISGDILTRIHDLHFNHGFAGDHKSATLLRFRFMGNVSEDIKVVAQWRMLNGIMTSGPWDGKNKDSGIIDMAFLQLNNKLNGDFLFGRTFAWNGHSLLINQYADLIRYTTVRGNSTYQLNSFFTRRAGKDTNQVWNLNFKQAKNGHNYYFGLYGQTSPDGYDLMNKADNANVKDGKRYDIELGSHGPLGNNEKFSYDVSAVFTKFKQEYRDATPEVDDNGVIAYGALNYDSKNQFKGKVSYYYANKKAHGGIMLNGDRRFASGPETPLEDIMRLDSFIGVMNNVLIDGNIHNFQDLKLQLEYKPSQSSKHYFRVAYDFLNNLKDDIDNPLGTDDGKAGVLTLEYKYRISKTLTLKAGLTNFKYDGKSNNGVNDAGYGTVISGGMPKDRDYRLFWTELYTKF